MSLLADGALLAAAVGLGLAFYKHHTLQGVIASAQKEAANIEAVASSVAADVKPTLAAIAGRLKSL